VIKHKNYKKEIVTSKIGRMAQSVFSTVKTNLAHKAFGKSALNYVIDFEHILLQTCLYLANPETPPETEKWMRIIIRSLAKSSSQQAQIDDFLQRLQLDSPEDKFIARLTWHKQNGTLPGGLPDPKQERLNRQNLEEKLDQALYNFLNSHMDKLLKFVISNDFKKGFLGFLYFLEGKDLISETFAYLIAEFGIKQIVDPHLFALAILQNSGIEVMDYELSGFGRGERNLILETGKKMIVKVRAKAPPLEIIDIFNQTHLKQTPGGFEEILQKKDVKKELQDCIASIVYTMIKSDEEFQNPSGLLKTARQKAQQLPIIGGATLTLHLLISGTFFSLDYLYRNKANQNVPYFTWMFKKFSGKNFSQYVAERIVSLIYHPSWRITLMQLIEVSMNTVENEPIKKEEWQKIVGFLFQHFTESTPVSLPKSITDYYTFESMIHQLFETSGSSNTTPLEKGIKNLTPTIKELLLYTRVIDSFRVKGICFDGDAKFWEHFIREYLNSHIASYSKDKALNLEELTEFRTFLVDQLLSLDPALLYESLSKTP
jgi:hypothetical protein